MFKLRYSYEHNLLYEVTSQTLLGWYWFTGVLMQAPWKNFGIEPSTRKKEYHCPFCEKTYYKSWHLKTHIQNIHGDLANPRFCTRCCRTYKNESSYQNHKRSCKTPDEQNISVSRGDIVLPAFKFNAE
jgi:hypothetical protein